jgi:RNA-directed DNA polymerase
MAAAKIVLEPIFDADFLPTSYGFRPGRSAHHALETIRQTVTWRGKQWALDADIRSCFDEIESHALVAQIELRVCDRRMFPSSSSGILMLDMLRYGSVSVARRRLSWPRTS